MGMYFADVQGNELRLTDPRHRFHPEGDTYAFVHYTVSQSSAGRWRADLFSHPVGYYFGTEELWRGGRDYSTPEAAMEACERHYLATRAYQDVGLPPDTPLDVVADAYLDEPGPHGDYPYAQDEPYLREEARARRNAHGT
jgi:hypothetical protein